MHLPFANKSSHTGRRNRTRARRLRFEPLEARHLLATFMVSNLDDSGPGSLRQAVLDANAAAGADEVGFEAGLTGTIPLTSGQIEITDDLTIAGPGAEQLTIDAQQNSRIFDASQQTMSLEVSGLTLTGGNTASGTNGTEGGAIRMLGPQSSPFAKLTVRASVITGNHASSRGGAIYVRGYVEFTQGTISDNSAVGEGGGIFSYSSGADEPLMKVIDSTISGNSSESLGGGLASGGDILIENSTVADNTASQGGGVYSLLGLVASTITENHSDECGGGVFAGYATRSMIIDRSTIAENTAACGGGIGGHDQVDIEITASTISGNIASGDGGGIHDARNLTIISSTISGNRASGDGGGVFAEKNISVSNSTITQNRAARGGGGIFAEEADELTIASSIVADNMAEGSCAPANPFLCFGITPSFDIARTAAIALTSSLIGSNTGTNLTPAPVGSPDVNGNLIGEAPIFLGKISPRLLPLADNGGPTMTHLPLSSSPAIDAGANPLNLATDQRGFNRQFGASVDMGAVERHNVFFVNSTGDGGDVNPGDGHCDDGSGMCTLRAAIEEANALPNIEVLGLIPVLPVECGNEDTSGLANIYGQRPDEILFDFPGDGLHTIRPTSALPPITDRVIIDGGQRIAENVAILAPPRIELDGSLAGDGASGLTINKNGSGSTIRSLTINRFDAHGIFISRSSYNNINYIYAGTDTRGEVDLGNGDAGVMVLNGARNTIFHSVVSANRRGIVLQGRLATRNQILKNRIGTDAAESAALGNTRAGVEIAGAPANLVANSNVIGGNRVGIDIRAQGATGNVIGESQIGIGGEGPIGNRIGVSIRDGAVQNFVHSSTIAGNTDDGIRIRRSDGNVLQNNRIGADSKDNAATGNGGDGVDIRESENNHVGGGYFSGNLEGCLLGQSNTHLPAGNTISGNAGFGINLMGDSNRIQANKIGTDAAAMVSVSNGAGGIQIAAGSDNEIGAERYRVNVISGNRGAGILIRGAASTGNLVVGNLIGTDVTGTAPLPNDLGVEIYGARNNTIGGPGFENTNVIAGNRREGVSIHSGATGNRLIGNSIGVERFTTPDEACVVSAVEANLCVILPPSIPETLAAIANGREGVLVAADGNTIGGAGEGEGNLISSNGRDGIRLVGDDNIVQGNQIGTDALGTGPMPNGRDGVRITGSNNAIGGTADGEANSIGFNAVSGVRVTSGTGNAILQNSIFDNGGLGIDLGRMGVNANDGPRDADAGANNLQNTPRVLRTSQTATDLQIIFRVPSQPPHSTYPIRVEFFVADNDGEEGQTFLAATDVALPTPAVISIPLADLPPGSKIVATATDADGNTSEFSVPLAVEQPAATTSAEAAADLVFQSLGA